MNDDDVTTDTAPGSDARASELEKKLADSEEQRLRVQADYQNLRRRVSSDIDAAVARASGPLLTDLLLVLDYLDMALASPCTSDDAKNLHAGVEMTRTQLWRALEREGVTVARESGAFDAAIHQATETLETNDRPAGEIVATLRRGFLRRGAILRPAQVRVTATPGAAEQR